MSFPQGLYGLKVTPEAFNIFFAAIVESVSEYLSLKYIISVMPDCIMAFVHSLHGKRVVYILEPARPMPL